MKRSHLSLAIGLVLALPLAATAQDAGSPDPDAPTSDEATTLGSMTVTARKREETLQDVPIAVTAFTPDALDRLNVSDLADLDAQVPNFTIYAARGSNTTITAFIRGVGQADPLWGVDPGVGMYLDDVYIARPQGALLDVFDVQRIEVLRGPQGTLYGKNTVGGAIKYISRDLPTELEGYGQLTAGNYGRADFKGAIGGALNDVARFRVSGATLNRDGFGRNIVTGEDVSDQNTDAVRVAFGLFPSDSFDIEFTYDFVDDNSGVRGAKMLAPNTNALVPAADYLPLDDRYDVRNGMPNINDTTMNGASMTATWIVGDAWVVKSITGWRQSETETNIDFDTLPLKIADVKAFYDDENLSQEFQANYDDGGDMRGVFGVYFFDGRAGGQVLNNFFNLSFGDTQGDVDTESWAVYGDWTWDFAERWSLNGGLRYTSEKKSADVLNRCYTSAAFDTLAAACTATNPTPIAADFEDSKTFENFSPKLVLDFDLTDNVLLYASASRGFKSGGFNIRAQATQFPNSRLPFDDEKVTSYEVGAKMAFLDQRLFLNAAYFNNDYKDIQLSVFTSFDSNGDGIDDAFFGDFTNAGAGTIEGYELEAQFLVTDAFRLSGNVATLNAEYDEFITSGVNVADAQRFTNAPSFSGAVNADYTVQLANEGELLLHAGYSYQSKIIPTTDLSPAITQDPYGLVNAGITWRSGGPWTVLLQGTNLTDKEYRTSGYNIASLGVLTGFYGAPRQYSLSVRYDF
ncbi:TonB-dependent receptor [Chiayiivirga flava]|uniref:Iron complex outermembrane receptor protein n=1 Tax=Chiayiivirga flava TaxID=659595 RepID=A0A7W8D517_9GAMM|nr:TonB-dependent receptor [Chiayiivirga flava]MBB5206821.1 iron complex outermembrane receptor protein [Chiayiivirga flava]